ncbi:hypothetical protein AN641_03560 [Candidatus Epulonipiscioides gigas]|nr:hypothetical protein AN641_03560 [Epulopiscium sp. SCG-C07WGA-EpuloA2]
MKKLKFMLVLSILMSGCANNAEMTTVKDSDTAVKQQIKETSTVVKVELEEEKEDIKVLLEDEKEQVKEERTAPLEIHVYSTEIPWDEDAQVTTSEYISINAALKDAIEGDTIIVHEGIYRETINVTKDNITITAPENEYVLITGNELVTNFVAEPTMPGVYVADVPSNYKEINLPFSQVFANGNYQNIARFPNYEIDDMMAPLEEGSGYGWLTDIHKPADTTEGFVTFRDGTLPNVDLTGAIFRGITGKNSEYVYGTVVSSEDNTISFDAYSRNNWQKSTAIKPGYHDFGFGFVLHKNLIDISGEWFVENRKLYYMPEGDINNLEIEMQVRKHVLIINNADNVNIENINFVSGNAQLTNIEGATINNCTFRYLQPFQMTTSYSIAAFAKSGIYLENATNNTIKNSYIAHTWGNGVYIISGDNNIISNCILEDIGWSGTFTAGVYTEGDYTRVEDCTFRDMGRFQTRVNVPVKIDIIHSLFERPMKMGEDSGAIAFANTMLHAHDLQGSEIAYNIIRDFESLPISSGNYDSPFLLAMYMEESTNYTIHHNLIYDLIDEDFLRDYAHIRSPYKANSLVYFSPQNKAMTEPNRFYNNTIWGTTSNFHIWNLVIANFDEVKSETFPYKTNTGGMSQGHFANNIFNVAPNGLNYNGKNFAPDGTTLKFASVPNSEQNSIFTYDMDEYFEHAASVGYYFNPETNMTFELETGASNFIDAENGDFRIAPDSPAKGAGTPIEGITSSENPDLGALEGSDYVLSAGSTLQVREFKETQN